MCVCVCVLFRVRDTLRVLVASEALKIISRLGYVALVPLCRRVGTPSFGDF